MEMSGRQAGSEARRHRILAAARACLGEGGATVEAIAERAGVSNGLLYQFFRNKRHLLEVVLEDVVQDWVRVMVPRDESESATARLEGMFRRSVDFCRTNPLLPALLTGDRNLPASKNVSGRVDAHRELVASILRGGIADGEFRADLDVPRVADVICQLHADYSSRAYRREPDHPADAATIDAAVRFIRDALV